MTGRAAMTIESDFAIYDCVTSALKVLWNVWGAPAQNVVTSRQELYAGARLSTSIPVQPSF